MPNDPWHPAFGPAPRDGMLEALLDGRPLPAEQDTLRPVADMLATLTATGGRDELAGHAHALGVFHAGFGVSTTTRRRHPWRRPMLTTLLSAKLAAALAAGAVGLGGAATVAYAGALPAPVQDFAHHTIGAPAAHPGTPPNPTVSASPHTAARPVGSPSPIASPRSGGPNPAGAAAYGLCNSYSQALAHGSAADKSVAFGNLITAAGGADKVTTYCATVVHPGATPSGQPSTHPTGQASTSPDAASSNDPTGKPTAPPTHPVSNHPTGEPTANPTAQPTDRRP
jgi:hypothetical protein